MKHIVAFVTLLLFPGFANCEAPLLETTLSVRVVGEDDRPISGATVGVGFELPYGVNEAFRSTTKEALSDGGGRATFTEKTAGQVSYGAAKEGYYRTIGEGVNFTARMLAREPLVADRTVVLRKIGSPAAMYARHVRAEIPLIDAAIGFDLIAGDWVAPAGKGSTADLIFTLKRQWVDSKNFDARLVVAFSNRADGIQSIEETLSYGSELKLPRIAPESGYEPRFSTGVSRESGKPVRNDARDNRSHLYRVRTVLDETGKVVSALYGKLRGDIRLDPINSKTATIRFTYYLNPDGTRNLEFDPKRNLYDGLGINEQVKEP